MSGGTDEKRDHHRRSRPSWRYCLAVAWLVAALVTEGGAEVTELEQEELRDERRGLLLLRDALRSALDLHSNWTGPPCHGDRSRWAGVACDADGRVVSLALSHAQLTGTLPRDALRGATRLSELRLRGNALRGALPRLEALGLGRLRVLDLSSNRFSGPIPRGYAGMRALERVELQDNLLTGGVPAFAQRGLVTFNVSYNFLRGEVPRAMWRFPASAFGHNLGLCGEAVRAACPPPSSGSAGSSRSDNTNPAVTKPGGEGSEQGAARFRLATWSVVAIALIAALVPVAAVLIFLYHTRRSRSRSREVRLGGGRAGAPGNVTGAGEDIKDKAAEQGKSGSGSRSTDSSAKSGVELQFFRWDRAGFDVDDLFRSTAETLGKGRLGITYRVTLDHAKSGVVVVKRLRNMARVPRREFSHTMRLLGKLPRHDNVLGLIACYYSKEEKLAVYEHVPGCSLFQLLHENRGEGRTPLPWPARLAIAKGVARGLAHLHHSLPYFHRPPHGNLKSSNVIVAASSTGNHHHHHQHKQVPKLTDYGFHPLLPHHAHRLAAAKCPEFARGGGGRRLSSRADVYCLGVVLLELVTGKVPVEEDGDLAEWARLALAHEWSTDILDVEIVADQPRHGDMLRLTEVALLCAAVDPERRPKVHDVVVMIDAIGDAGDGEQQPPAGLR
ncbi:hypothetical protein PR202_gb29812 [Eleusine coracana subsp. coracana]|uniref:Protein kinase domain-containing protein n=1 Tax=Eleusine coracana subsp. coracana TaxID=191504 RepID=A0AAV5G0C5_ELECO|nr:hypothetical protein QOZ80_2BG0165550 [Eleusine coracana subsp. coracana]GJN40579.1 hypothetical protein PR202_gb29812 [Eleusine coracana subsp. coracana]